MICIMCVHLLYILHIYITSIAARSSSANCSRHKRCSRKVEILKYVCAAVNSYSQYDRKLTFEKLHPTSRLYRYTVNIYDISYMIYSMFICLIYIYYTFKTSRRWICIIYICYTLFTHIAYLVCLLQCALQLRAAFHFLLHP